MTTLWFTPGFPAAFQEENNHTCQLEQYEYNDASFSRVLLPTTLAQKKRNVNSFSHALGAERRARPCIDAKMLIKLSEY